jgi:hypothetical protein
MQEEQQDTRESDALAAGEVRFEREDVEAVGDPAAASVDAPDDAAPDAAGDALPSADDPDPVATAPADTPAAADRRGAELAEGPPFVAIAGAFVGSFVAAKLLGKLGGGGD